MPTMTRQDMEDVIKGGGSVIYRGAVLASVADLPDEADLAEGDAERVAAARAAIEAQRSALDAQLARLNQPHIVAAKPGLTGALSGEAPPRPDAVRRSRRGAEAEEQEPAQGAAEPPKE